MTFEEACRHPVVVVLHHTMEVAGVWLPEPLATWAWKGLVAVQDRCIDWLTGVSGS